MNARACVQLPYDFQWHHMNFPVDIPLLILSEAKSITPTDCVVPLSRAAADTLRASGAAGSAALPPLPASLPDIVRMYFAGMRGLAHTIEPHVATAVQDDIVAMRGALHISVGAACAGVRAFSPCVYPTMCLGVARLSGASLTGAHRRCSCACCVCVSVRVCPWRQTDELHLRMDLARLASISAGESVLSLHTWQRVKALEAERVSRLPPPPVAPGHATVVPPSPSRVTALPADS